MATKHEFGRDLAWSKDSAGDARTERILRQYFSAPTDFSCSFRAREKPFQHDLEIIAFGDRYRVEEKRRRKDYGDELLEDISRSTTDSPGWMWNASSVDYLLFVYPERFTIWPGRELERAWRAYRNGWIAEYGTKRALNHGYETISVPVPSVELQSALKEFGAPICLHCASNVGRFRSTCQECGAVSCCAVSDGGWLCSWCS